MRGVCKVTGGGGVCALQHPAAHAQRARSGAPGLPSSRLSRRSSTSRARQRKSKLRTDARGHGRPERRGMLSRDGRRRVAERRRRVGGNAEGALFGWPSSWLEALRGGECRHRSQSRKTEHAKTWARSLHDSTCFCCFTHLAMQANPCSAALPTQTSEKQTRGRRGQKPHAGHAPELPLLRV